VAVEEQGQGTRLTALVDFWVTLGLGAFATWTLWTHLALAIGLTFLQLSIAFSLTVPITIGLLVRFARRSRGSTRFVETADGRHAGTMLLLLVVLGLAVSVLAIRPDLDDVDYVSHAVFYLEHPSEPLVFARHDHALLSEPLRWPLYIFYALELSCSYAAWITGLPLLAVYHVALPALGGALIPLAWFLAFSRYSRVAWGAVLAAVAVCVFLSLNGEPHRSFGNFAFVRIWHGKAVLMSILVPLGIAYARDALREGGSLPLVRLGFVSIAATGLSPMSLFFVPALALVQGVAQVAGAGREHRPSWRALAGYFASFGYVVIPGLWFIGMDTREITLHGSRNWPTVALGQQFDFVFIGPGAYPTLALATCTLLSLGFARPPERRMLIAWILACLILFMNPLVFPFVSEHLTTLNNYWRLFFLLPVPFVVGFPWTRFPPGSARASTAGAALALLLLVAVTGNLWAPIRDSGHATLGRLPFRPGRYKVDPAVEAEVETIIAHAQPGPMLAPDRLSCIIPRYSSAFPQIIVRDYMLGLHRTSPAERMENRQRRAAVAYVSGRSGGSEEAKSLIGKGIATVVLDPRVTRQQDWDDFARFLDRNGFERTASEAGFVLYARVD